AAVAIRLCDPVVDRLRRRLELARKLFRRPAGFDSLDHLRPELRRVGVVVLSHGRHLLFQRIGVHETGSTPMCVRFAVESAFALAWNTHSSAPRGSDTMRC